MLGDGADSSHLFGGLNKKVIDLSFKFTFLKDQGQFYRGIPGFSVLKQNADSK